MPYTWNDWTCFDIPGAGVKNCSLTNQNVCGLPYDPSNPYWSTWCGAPLSDQEAAPYGGNFYNTIIAREPNESINFSKNLFIYGVYFAIIVVGIIVLALIL